MIKNIIIINIFIGILFATNNFKSNFELNTTLSLLLPKNSECKKEFNNEINKVKKLIKYYKTNKNIGYWIYRKNNNIYKIIQIYENRIKYNTSLNSKVVIVDDKLEKNNKNKDIVLLDISKVVFIEYTKKHICNEGIKINGEIKETKQ